MAFQEGLQGNWFTLLQSAGIIGSFLFSAVSLLFTAISLRRDVKDRRVTNLLRSTEAHRNIWSVRYARPELARVEEATVDLEAQPVTREEEIWVNSLILHLSGSYRAIQEGLFTSVEGLQRDIALFFALPIPRAVWKNLKSFQNHDFVRFVEEAMEKDG